MSKSHIKSIERKTKELVVLIHSSKMPKTFNSVDANKWSKANQRAVLLISRGADIAIEAERMKDK